MDRPPFPLALVAQTPGWVWLLLALLIVLGWRLSLPQVATRTRVLALPVVLGLVALYAATSAFGRHAWVQALWMLGLALGLALNLWLRQPGRVRALGDGRFEIAGSWWPLALMLAVFTTRYAVSAALAVAPALAQQPLFAGTASLLYGLPTGLVAARAARVLACERRRPAPAA